MIEWLSNRFDDWEFIFLLGVIPLLIIWYSILAKNWNPEIKFSSLGGFGGIKRSPLAYFRHLPFVLRIIALGLMIIAFARPQSSSSLQNVTAEGIDIIIALDISTSMLAEDFKPNRLEASKDVAIDFISERPMDRIGLVIFSGESFTQCPITTDHDVVKNLFKDVKTGLLEDGTAIGMGLATSITRLRLSEAKSKIIILLTDGDNNAGNITPFTASRFAKKHGIRVYTVGVGTNGLARYPIQTPFGKQYQNIPVKIDEPTLKTIAKETGGKYFRATDNETLAEVYREIDKLEKSKFEVFEFSKKTELFMPYVLIACILLIASMLLKFTILRTVP